MCVCVSVCVCVCLCVSVCVCVCLCVCVCVCVHQLERQTIDLILSHAPRKNDVGVVYFRAQVVDFDALIVHLL